MRIIVEPFFVAEACFTKLQFSLEKPRLRRINRIRQRNLRFVTRLRSNLITVFAYESGGLSPRGGQMQNMTNCEWFCANCLRMIEVLSRHGRCPHCDSNAVDLAYRGHIPGKGQLEAKPDIILSINI